MLNGGLQGISHGGVPGEVEEVRMINDELLNKKGVCGNDVARRMNWECGVEGFAWNVCSAREVDVYWRGVERQWGLDGRGC